MNADLKLKSYEQLQNEVTTLIKNNYLKDLKINRLQNNWDSLKKWLKEVNEFQRHMCNIKDNHITIIEAVLERIDKLESEAINE